MPTTLTFEQKLEWISTLLKTPQISKDQSILLKDIQQRTIKSEIDSLQQLLNIQKQQDELYDVMRQHPNITEISTANLFLQNQDQKIANTSNKKQPHSKAKKSKPKAKPKAKSKPKPKGIIKSKPIEKITRGSTQKQTAQTIEKSKQKKKQTTMKKKVVSGIKKKVQKKGKGKGKK